ncbi:hypothetical protein DL93DRAFT_2046853, partial [Clavulina sp. PMI_390]
TSELLGYFSIASWLGAQFPQLFENARRQSVDGLALPFLANWFLGDATNLIGCILTEQLPFQTAVATYFVFVDLCLLVQYLYYSQERFNSVGSIRLRSGSRRRTLSNHLLHITTSTPANPNPKAPEQGETSTGTTGGTSRSKKVAGVPVVLLGALMLVSYGPSQLPDSSSREWRLFIGRISAWICTCLYLTSRLPQIWKNFARKSVEGLTMSLFVCAFLGNSFYVASILSSPILDDPRPGVSAAFLRESIPYILGSGGTLLFDITIVLQSLHYR